jgi:uncharacterized protein YutD
MKQGKPARTSDRFVREATNILKQHGWRDISERRPPRIFKPTDGRARTYLAAYCAYGHAVFVVLRNRSHRNKLAQLARMARKFKPRSTP